MFVPLPDGLHLAVGYEDGSVRIFSLLSGEGNVTFNGHKAAITSLKYDQLGGRLASGSKVRPWIRLPWLWSGKRSIRLMLKQVVLKNCWLKQLGTLCTKNSISGSIEWEGCIWIGWPSCFLSDSLIKACKIWEQDEAVHDNYHVTSLYICLPKTVHKVGGWSILEGRVKWCFLAIHFGKISHFPVSQSSGRK